MMKQMNKDNRNHCLDAMKGCACIAVVFMHCEFPGKLGILVQCLTRFSVPLFFIVSGYFCVFDDNDIAKRKIKKKIRHIGEITIWSCILYALFTIGKNCVLDGMSIIDFLTDRLGAKEWMEFLIFNQPIVVAGHLWFLFALLYSYCFFLLLSYSEKKISQKNLKRIMVALLAVHFCIGQLAYIISQKSISSCYYRNFLFEGIPFMILGMLIKTKNSRKINDISDRKIWFLFFSGSILCIVERILIGRDFSIHFGTILQVYSMIVYAVKNKELLVSRTLELIGRDYSLYIYVLHMVIFSILSIGANILGISNNQIYLYLQPVLVVCCSIVCAMVIKYIQEQWRKQRCMI